MSMVQQKVVMRDVLCHCKINRHSHLSNGIMIKPKNCLGLLGFRPHNNQPVVPYNQETTLSLIYPDILVNYIFYADPDRHTVTMG